MSIERARAYFKNLGMENRILEFDVSSATVELAAQDVYKRQGYVRSDRCQYPPESTLQSSFYSEYNRFRRSPGIYP